MIQVNILKGNNTSTAKSLWTSLKLSWKVENHNMNGKKNYYLWRAFLFALLALFAVQPFYINLRPEYVWNSRIYIKVGT